MLFGMAGTWEEYNEWGDTKESLLLPAIKHLKYDHDANILELATNKVTKLRLKDKGNEVLGSDAERQ